MRRSLSYILATQWRRSVVEKSGTEWTAVFVCLLVGIFIWLVMALSKPYSYMISMPVSYAYDATTYQPADDLPKRLQMNVSGLGWRLLIHQLGIGKSSLVITPQKVKAQPNLLITEDYLYELVKQQYPDLKIASINSEPVLMRFEPIKSYQLPITVDDNDISVADTVARTSAWSVHPESVMIKAIPSVWEKLPKPMLVKLPKKKVTKDHEEVIPLETKSYKKVEFMQQEVLVSATFGHPVNSFLLIPLNQSVDLQLTKTKSRQSAKSIVPTARFDFEYDSRQSANITADSFRLKLVKQQNGLLTVKPDHLPGNVFNVRLKLIDHPNLLLDTAEQRYKWLK